MRKTARQRVFEALHAAGSRGATTSELAHPSVGGVRFSARIMELREEGHTIHEQYERPGRHRYHLTGSVVGEVTRAVGSLSSSDAALVASPTAELMVSPWFCHRCGLRSPGDRPPADCCENQFAVRARVLPPRAREDEVCDCARCDQGYPCANARDAA